MQSTNRYGIHRLVLLFILTTVAAGCILVVEDDSDRRHRRLQGFEWTVDVVFYRAATMTANDREMTMTFHEDGTLSGRTGCGSFDGAYQTNDNQGMTITSVSMDSGCESDSRTSLFVDRLASATSYSADDQSLKLQTAGEGYISFLRTDQGRGPGAG